MFTPIPTALAHRSSGGRPISLAGKIAVGASAILLMGGAAVGVAAATGADAHEPAPYEPSPDEEIEIDDSDQWAGLEVPAPTPEDLVLQDDFDQCLTDNGVPPAGPGEEFDDGAEEPEPVEIDSEILDACMPILDGMSTRDFFGNADAPMPVLVEVIDEE